MDEVKEHIRRVVGLGNAATRFFQHDLVKELDQLHALLTEYSLGRWWQSPWFSSSVEHWLRFQR